MGAADPSAGGGFDVAADQAVGTARAPRQLAHDDARAATDLQHALARHDRQRIEQSAYDGHISRAAALLEAGDAAEQRAAKGYRAIACMQRGEQPSRAALTGRVPIATASPPTGLEVFSDLPSSIRSRDR
jgi:hypothetical protein